VKFFSTLELVMELTTEPLPYSPSGYDENNNYTVEPSFCQCLCFKYFCGCNLFMVIGLAISLGFVIVIYPIGLIFAAVTPGYNLPSLLLSDKSILCRCGDLDIDIPLLQRLCHHWSNAWYVFLNL
jgi:hypothetical protein